ncbi:SDR family oxidoreductase [Hymenobacter ginsengisoli]|uniref:SDR family oxidoreductase n=1 Tax=Hymenobacter ginsengisoli TaxID=1051626 RepID=A0ABP8Q3N2_9BACT|nr:MULTISPECIES: SDR family oxidoreductase [unclassified Hymenobacter]MBO2032455.1 SDR family oxidoreductase [Hymenobacter sp. BT559]
MPTSTSARLAGQFALVTGASSGIGAAVAVALGAHGAAVAVNYGHDADGANATVKTITDAGGTAFAVQADVSKEDQVQAMFQQAIERLGGLHIVVSNAGIQVDAALVDMTLEQWQKVIDVNLTGQFLCVREAARTFIKRGMQPDVSKALGKIICMSSVHEVIPWAGHVNYATSKGGIMQLMKSSAQELAPHKIRVNSIGPGAIKTHINTAAWDTPEAEASLLKLIPYARVGEPDDIGQLAAWLASDEADYITGQTIFMDGGMTLYPGFAAGG